MVISEKDPWSPQDRPLFPGLEGSTMMFQGPIRLLRFRTQRFEAVMLI